MFIVDRGRSRQREESRLNVASRLSRTMRGQSRRERERVWNGRPGVGRWGGAVGGWT